MLSSNIWITDVYVFGPFGVYMCMNMLKKMFTPPPPPPPPREREKRREGEREAPLTSKLALFPGFSTRNFFNKFSQSAGERKHHTQ